MSVRTFFDDLLKDLARGGGSIVPAELAATPAPTPADGDELQDTTDDEPADAGELEDDEPADAGELEDDEPADAGELEDDEPADVLEADALARRLHAALVQLDGRVSDPAAVPFDPAHLDGDGAALTAAIDGLVESNPAIRSRQYGGDIGAGSRGSAPAAPVDLIQLMRGA